MFTFNHRAYFCTPDIHINLKLNERMFKASHTLCNAQTIHNNLNAKCYVSESVAIANLTRQMHYSLI